MAISFYWDREVGANPWVSWEKKQFHIDNAATVKLHLAFADKSAPLTKEFSTPQAICAVHWTSESQQAPRHTQGIFLFRVERSEGTTALGGQKVWMVTLQEGQSFWNGNGEKLETSRWTESQSCIWRVSGLLGGYKPAIGLHGIRQNWHYNILFSCGIIENNLNRCILKDLIYIEWFRWFCRGVLFIKEPKQTLLCLIYWSRMIVTGSSFWTQILHVSSDKFHYYT